MRLRIKEAVEGRTQNKLAEKVFPDSTPNRARQKLSGLNTGNRRVKLSEALIVVRETGASLDFLTGRTDHRTLKDEMLAVHEETGERSVKKFIARFAEHKNNQK